jgi:hypothetical protein
VPSAIQELLTAIDLFAISSSQSNSFKYRNGRKKN